MRSPCKAHAYPPCPLILTPLTLRLVPASKPTKHHLIEGVERKEPWVAAHKIGHGVGDGSCTHQALHNSGTAQLRPRIPRPSLITVSVAHDWGEWACRACPKLANSIAPCLVQ